MRINRLRGTVADSPIDSVVVQEDRQPGSAMQRIVAMQLPVDEVEVTRRPTYEKG